MRRLGKALANAGYFLVCYAALPLLAGQLIMGDCLPPLIMLPVVLLLAVLLSFLPGKIGGGSKVEVAAVVRTTHGNDPNPDRALRNEALPAEERRSFPLRAFVGLICFLALGVAVFIVSEGQLALRILMAILISGMLPLALRVVAMDSNDTISILTGVILYAAAGIVGYGMRDEGFNRLIMTFGLIFLLTTALGMNNLSMANGATVRAGVRPPASMRRRNRVMLIVLAVIGAIVLYFDRIRVATIAATQWVIGIIMTVIGWLFSFLPETSQQGGGGGGGNELEMLQELGPAESAVFWKILEKFAVVLAIVAIAVLLVLVVRKIWQMLCRAFRRIAAYLKKFTSAVSEEYHDEQESLFDWGETKRELGEGFRKRLERITKREKKWEQMDVRERVRYIVRSLYRKSPEKGGLRSLTVQEAVRVIRTGQAQPEELAALYDEARYSHHEPSLEQAERLRKEAKV